MSKKRKGKYTLYEALNLLDEATYSRGYPDDGTGVAGDDDRPPGNIVYGEKYKKAPYFNKLTLYDKIWKVDLGDWTWDEFELSGGMEDLRNYSNTLQGMKELFPKETWKNVWKRMKYVSPEDATKGFIDAGQPWRKGGEDQAGVDKHDHVEVDMNKRFEFKDAEVEDKGLKEDTLVDRLYDITL